MPPRVRVEAGLCQRPGMRHPGGTRPGRGGQPSRSQPQGQGNASRRRSLCPGLRLASSRANGSRLRSSSHPRANHPGQSHRAIPHRPLGQAACEYAARHPDPEAVCSTAFRARGPPCTSIGRSPTLAKARPEGCKPDHNRCCPVIGASSRAQPDANRLNRAGVLSSTIASKWCRVRKPESR